MIGAEIVEELRLSLKKASVSQSGPPKVYAWASALFDAIARHNRTDTLESLKAIKKVVKEVPEQDAKECEEALESLGFVLHFEKVRILQQEELERIAEKRMIENTFRVNSGLTLYRETFGEPFSTAVDKMADTSRWLDGGAGEANAMIEHLDNGGKGRCVAIGFKIPVQAVENVARATNTYKERFRYVDGKYFGEMSDLELGGTGFDLITDLNGVLYYTKTLMEDLKRYLQLLNVGGVLVFTSIHVEIDMPNAAQHVGYVPAMARWSSNIGGATLRYHEKAGFYEMRKVSAEIVMPDIVLNLYETQEKQNDPIRKYSCVHALPNQVVKAD